MPTYYGSVPKGSNWGLSSCLWKPTAVRQVMESHGFCFHHLVKSDLAWVGDSNASSPTGNKSGWQYVILCHQVFVLPPWLCRLPSWADCYQGTLQVSLGYQVLWVRYTIYRILSPGIPSEVCVDPPIHCPYYQWSQIVGMTTPGRVEVVSTQRIWVLLWFKGYLDSNVCSCRFGSTTIQLMRQYWIIKIESNRMSPDL